MKELIDRKAAIDAIGRDPMGGLNYERILSEMPTESRWIPLTVRPMDEEERLEWCEKLGYDIEYEDAVIYTSQLPDDGQEVLTCNRYGHIATDKFANDPDYGCFFEEYGEMDGIVAWMPLPEPYEERREADGTD